MLIFATISKFIVLYKLFKTLKIMKKIFTFAFALVCAIAANAQTFTLSGAQKEIAPVVLTAGDQKAIAYIYAEGVGNFCAFELNLFLPEGVAIAKAACSDLTKDEDGENTHSVEFNNKGAEGWKLLCYNASLAKFSADKGAVSKLTLTVDAGFKGGEAQFKGGLISDPKTELIDSKVITIAETTGINEVKAIDVNAPKYNFQGVQVKDAKMFIQNGKKYIK